MSDVIIVGILSLIGTLVGALGTYFGQEASYATRLFARNMPARFFAMGSHKESGFTPSLDVRYKLSIGATSDYCYLSVDGVEKSKITGVFGTAAGPLYICASYYNGTVNGIAKEGLRVYGVLCSKDGSTVNSYIPCYLKTAWNGIPAGTIGMYDLCGSLSNNGTPFYTNSGTGAFTKGADVT